MFQYVNVFPVKSDAAGCPRRFGFQESANFAIWRDLDCTSAAGSCDVGHTLFIHGQTAQERRILP